MIDFTIYDATGKILRIGFCPDGMEKIQAQTGESMLPVTSDLELDYVLDGAVTPRPANPATVAGTALANLPAPCTISINGTSYPCTDATATLTLTHSGAYTVIVSAWPYLDAQFAVTV